MEENHTADWNFFRPSSSSVPVIISRELVGSERREGKGRGMAIHDLQGIDHRYLLLMGQEDLFN